MTAAFGVITAWGVQLRSKMSNGGPLADDVFDEGIVIRWYYENRRWIISERIIKLIVVADLDSVFR